MGPLFHRLRHGADTRGGHALAALPSLLVDLRETATVAQLAEAILTRVERGVQASRGVLMVDGAETGGFGASVDVAFPVRVKLAAEHFDVEGELLLGPRADGRPYTPRQHKALEAIADPVARALTIVVHRERAVTEQQWLIHSLDMRLTQLEMLLAAKN